MSNKIHECNQLKNSKNNRAYLPTFNHADVDYLEKESDTWYMVINGEYSTPIKVCPFCGETLR
jgi:hypothetical protein